MRKRVVVTGLGVVASNAVGKDAFMQAVFNSISGIKPVSLFDTAGFSAKTAGEIGGFAPEAILGAKGLRTLDRSTKLLLCATKLALDDAKVIMDDSNTCEAGVVVGNTLGSVSSISNFDRDAVIDGPQYVNPALFPNTVINSPASQVSLRFNIKGLNTTISTGFSASLDALKYAYDFLRLGRAKFILAGAVEELCEQIYLGFYKTGFLAGTSLGSVELSCPFDKRRNGIVLSEGAGILVLEELGSAVDRGANIYAEVSGFGWGFGQAGLTQSMQMASRESAIGLDQIGYISAAANSTVYADKIEAISIKNVFSSVGELPPVTALKSIVGESYSAGGVLQSIEAVLALTRQGVPAMANYAEADPECGLNFVTGKTLECEVNNVLVNSCASQARTASAVFSKFRG